ncbi:YebC/PmpR family DNA-binding transcriptional regulator [Candidatus Falkowbacteria bacterium CG10_big_fil_rev_8_21_14_0_10_37_14]|uniref:Probable transcriptional regulatory protein COT94_03585 n=1 Tax=Candidatus Falkowbacteria bacterium CG10_big_fil_rev_8_21_14_0_10_37_14 TaxID=1974561 RepID=A0A2M6WSY0_9BACT|nr:YebC/PmpR family DNA-binding transcriptional regulator [Candidatus Falkowbacteria bacterium]PIT95816.1 MAG: YebC/PmpR family DNA-binding transcriptional regulator [Candidatus Falkowbacteria bacterium CG10_big_fil_rev_8_21_14_0_10_37_14]
MSGHSKWATTKRAKAVVDAKRGAAFTKVANNIVIAARNGGDPTTNFQLRIAVDKARSVNMPKENIDRAIKRGTGELGGTAPEELLYEAVGPAQSQFIVKCLSDNRNRTAAVIRHIFDKHGGSMGAVLWNFAQLGVITITAENLKGQDFETLEMELIDQGVEDILMEDEGVTLYTHVSDLQKIKHFLDNKKIVTDSAEMEYVAKEKIAVSDSDDEKIEKTIDELDNCEEVADYYTNLK